MKIICVKDNLKEAISLCEKVTGKNLSLPILSNILISGEGKELKITSTNLEVGLEIIIPAKIEKEGKTAVPAGIINNFISSLSGNDNITLELQNSNLSVFTPNTSTLIKCQTPEDFPIFPKVKPSDNIEIPSHDLILGLKSVWYSASLLNIKPEISSVYLRSGKNIPITYVSTDSFRLAEKKFNYSFDGFNGILIPIKSVSEILRVFEGRGGKVKLLSDKNQILLELDNIKFISRLTEGVFPDYKQIIPNKFITDVIIDKSIFIKSLKTASIFSGKLNEINMIIGSDNDFITIETSSSDTGEHIANLPAKITGEEIKMSFSYKYIFDCLQYIPSQEIILRFSGEGRPLILTGVNDNSFQYLVMPMNSM